MKQFLFTLITLSLCFSVKADHYPKTHCANYHTKKCYLIDMCGKVIDTIEVPENEDCPEGYTEQHPEVDDSEQSKINSLSFGYTHDVTDYIPSYSQGGCGSCSGGNTKAGSYRVLSLERFHRFRQMSERGSFGPGIFSNYDAYFTMYLNGTTPQVDMFFGGAMSMRRYYKQGSAFYETFSGTSKGLEIRKADGTPTTDLSLAHHAVLESFKGSTYYFEIFEIDEFTKGGRLSKLTDRNGYEIVLNYSHAFDSTVDSSEKYKINTVTDPSNRTLTFEYLSETKSGMWVVSKVFLPNGSFISYNYGASTDGSLESIDYPDGTTSTFSAAVDVDGHTIVSIFEAGEKGTHRNKKLNLDSNFNAGATGKDGIKYWNSSSLLINNITIGSGTEEERSYAIYQNPSGGNNRRIFKGGNSLKTVNIISASFYKQWNKDSASDDFNSYSGLSTEETATSGDWRFYLANAQMRPPIMTDKHGVTHKYVYNSAHRKTKKIYEDDTFERWSYNDFNQPTRHRDRLGRVTHWNYDTRGNLLSKTVGMVAQPAGTAGETIQGLLCKVYDWTNNTLPTDYNALTPVETLSVPNLEISATDREDAYALEFSGEIEITTAGDYTFFLSSDDGSKLYIDDVLIIDNDGLHSNTELSNEVPLTLTAGQHTIRVEFFEKYGLQELYLKYQGPDSGEVKMTVPDSVYTHTSVEEELQEVDVTTPEMATFYYSYYEAGHPNQYLLKTETDANGNITTYTYNSDNLLEYIKTMNDDGDLNAINKSYFTYDSAKRLLTSSDARGRTTTYAYDSRDRVIKITYNDFSTEVFFYGHGGDANLLVKKKDRNGITTKLEYDSLGRAETTISAYSIMPDNPSNINDETVNPSSLQSIETCTYLPGTGLKSTCTINGDLTEFFYDYRNRLVEVKKHADNNSILTKKSFYKNNLLQWQEDPYGRRTYFSYRIRGAEKSDSVMTRMVQETVPGAINLPNGYYSDIDALNPVTGPNASYLITDYDKDVEGQTIEVTDPRRIVHQTQYDSRGRTVVQISDAGTGGLNQTSQTIYDANSNVIGIINPRYFEDGTLDGLVMEYTSRNLLKSRTVAKIYSEDGDPNPPATSLSEATESYTYYDDGRPETHTDFKDYTTTQVWKQCCGRLGVVAGPVFTDKAGSRVRKATIIQYDFYGNQTHTADMVIGENEALPSCCENNPENTKTLTEVTIKYDARHRPVARTVWLQPLDVVDPNDVPIATDPTIGLTTRYHYFDEADAANTFVSTLLTKLPAEVTMGTFTNGSAVVTENAEGEKSVAVLDGAGRTVASGMLSKEDDSLVTWNTMVYDNVVGNLLETKSISALGFQNTVYTDGAGRRIISKDTQGKSLNFFYDNNSNMVSFRDANGVGQDCVYDNLNRETECTDTYGATTVKGYDLNSNIVTVTDAKNKISNIEYDARNRRTSVTDRNNGTTSYTYDDNSNIETITDALLKVTTYEYDERNLQVQVTYDDHIEGQTAGDADYGITECKYDALGRKELFIDQKGDNVTYIYDMASRLEKRQYRNHNISTVESEDTFTYDDASRMETASKGRYNNTVTFTYDKIGRNESETTSVGGNNYTVTYLDYDDDNRLKEILYPTGANNTSLTRTKLEKSYTSRNQLLSLTLNASPIISNFGYDDGMREETRTFGNGLTSTRAYRSVGSGATAQKDNLLSSITVSGSVGILPELGFSYDYDENKNVESETTGGVLSSYSWNTTFDDIDRLKTWDRTGLF